MNPASITLAILLTSAPVFAQTFLGPSPYLSEADSPFDLSGNSGLYYLEDFEDGQLNVPGVTASHGMAAVPAFPTADSVDGDDGNPTDGLCIGCNAWWAPADPGVTFTFDATVLGHLPTHVGIVWTDGGGCCPPSATTVTMEAFGPGGSSLGVLTGIGIGDTFTVPSTPEDRFFGIENAAGISAIRISEQSLAGMELDHLQYGPIDLYRDLCNGDGGDQMGCTNCPCPNNATPGTIGGCLNSAGTSARLDATGDPSVSLPAGDVTDLRFAISGAPANAFCILNSGDNVAPGGALNPCFGLNSGIQAMQFDGLRCAIQNTRRHGGRSADGNGDIGVTNNPWGGEGGPNLGIAQAFGGFSSGQTRYFQVINRDDPLLSCERGLNTSQAVEVTFLP